MSNDVGVLGAGEMSQSTSLATMRKYFVQIAIVCLAYVVAGKLGQATTSIRSSNLGPVWPAYGIALAAILRYGYRVWPGVMAGAFLVAFFSPVPHITALGQSAGATLAAMTGAFLLHHFVDFRPSLSRLADALGLIVFGALVSALVSASVGVAVLYATHVHAYSGLGAAWLIYWLGDATGVLLVTPLALTFREFFKLGRDRITEVVLLLLFLTTTCFVVFSGLPPIPDKLDVMAFAVLLFVIWAAVRFGIGGATISVLLTATTATVATAYGSGPFAQDSPFKNAVFLDLYFALLSISGITLAAIVAEREQLVRHQAAMETRLRLATIVESTDDAIISKNLDGVITSWNAAAKQIFGFTETEAIGQPITILIPPELRDEENEILQKLKIGQRLERLESTRTTKTGKKVDVSLTISPIKNAVGRVVGASIISRDISARKRADEALKKSEEKFSKAFRQSPMALTLTSAKDYRYLDVNETFERLTGWHRDEVIGRTPFDMGICLDPTERAEFVRQVLAEHAVRDWEVHYHHKDGTEGVGLSAGELIEIENEPCILSAIADITDRKRAEEALREGEDKLRLILDSTAEAIYGIDLEHRCTFCNPACLRTLGYERIDEVLGKNMHNLIHHTRADGTLFPIEECQVHRAARTGEGVHAEDELMWRANGTSFPVEYWSYPQRKGHEVVGAVVAFIDITERKLAEAALASVSGRLIEAQEQERSRIGRELHDDIGQRLALLAMELEELHNDSLILPGVRSRMGELQKQTSEIAADIQSLSHELHSAKLQYLGIAGAMRGFCREFGEQQRVEVDFQTHDLPDPLSADTSLCFFRVLQESLHNAVKHSGAKHFEVRLWGTSDEIHLTVRDSGEGFDRAAAKTSQGLGLVSMEERLKLVKGTLSIDSQAKRGTTIHAYVPFNSGTDSMRAAG
jgi:PAS domain S-box-containing protein